MKKFLLLLLTVFLLSCAPAYVSNHAKILKPENPKLSLVRYLSRENLVKKTAYDSLVKIKNTPTVQKALLRYLEICRKRIDIIAKNLTNRNSAYNKDGNPTYQPQQFVLTEKNQPKVISDTATTRRYDPNHPKANPKGYVFYPKIQPELETIKMIEANRQYKLTASILRKFNPDIVIPPHSKSGTVVDY